MEFVPPIALLTDDLLLHVLSFLPHPPHRKSFRATCKAFYRADALHRTHLRLLRPQFLPSLLSKFPRLVSLDLSVCPRFDDAAVSVLVSASAPIWPKIKRLTLNRCVGLRFRGLETLMRSCVSVESVDVSYCCDFGDLEAAALSCASGLRELNLDKCLNVSDVGLANIVVGCPNLEKLSVKWCFDITDLGLEFLSKKCVDLKHLDISCLKVTSESLRWISGMKKLEVLKMVGCGSVDDLGLHFIAKGCPSLEVLDLSRCDQLSASALGSVIRGHDCLLQLHASYCFSELPIGFANQFMDLKKLNALRIDGAHVSDAVLKVISRNCRFLSEIGLSKCGVTDMGIMQLVSGCVKLKVLNLTCCSDLTDASILTIAYSCPDVVCLQLECFNFLSARSLNFIGSCCLLLKEIDLTDCPGVNDMGLKYISKCVELVSLKLGLCTNISDKGLSYIASNCLKMRELDLYRCEGVGDDGIGAISYGCKNLQKIILSYCSGITDRGLGCLGSLEELSDLEMRSLCNITGAGLKKVAMGCWRLAELDLKNCKNIDDSGFWALACYCRNLLQEAASFAYYLYEMCLQTGQIVCVLSSTLHGRALVMIYLNSQLQINVSGTAISNLGLCMLIAKLTLIQDMKLVNLTNVSLHGLEVALRASSQRLKKVKLHASLRLVLSDELIDTLESKGCKIRWD